jgi:hypothetical protein
VEIFCAAWEQHEQCCYYWAIAKLMSWVADSRTTIYSRVEQNHIREYIWSSLPTKEGERWL